MRKFSVAVVAIAMVIGGAGCSASTDDQAGAGGKADVATLESGTPSVAASAKQAERPRKRLDDTPEDTRARYKPYEDCLLEHGFDITKDRGNRNFPTAKKDAAAKACENLIPLEPWELDPANPEVGDFMRDVVKCLKGKGLEHAALGDDGKSWTVNDGEVDPNSISKSDSESVQKVMDLGEACQREVAAKRK
ncbi:hypothetical protein ACFYL6_20205 [Micromonospora sp. NPDC007208]|uniref:hypothetical protein n=1 Tax=Micromonospora sp. NPDC007208 TaxID=3364236 RepID=UPI0036BF29C6